MRQHIRNASLMAAASAVAIISYAPVAYSANIFGNTPNIGGADDIHLTITTIISRFLELMALIAVVIIVIAGVRMVISQGEQDAVEKAKKTILYAIIGLIIILLARAIVEFVAGFID